MSGSKGAQCAAQYCPNYRKSCPDMSFFRFPSEKSRCLKWIINTRRKDLQATFFQISSKSYFSSNFVLCAAHFTDCCFMNSKCNRLVHDAVPSLFTVHADETSEPMSSVLSSLQRSLGYNRDDDKDIYAALEEIQKLELLITNNIDEILLQKYTRTVNICIPHDHGQHMAAATQGLEVKISSWQLDHIDPVHVPSTLSTTNTSAGYYLCCAEGCLSTSTCSPLYPFPCYSQQAKVWLDRCGRADLKPLLDSHGSVPSNILLCDKHFRKNQFVEDDGNKCKALMKHAMPTIFKRYSEKLQKCSALRFYDLSPGKLKLVSEDRLQHKEPKNSCSLQCATNSRQSPDECLAIIAAHNGPTRWLDGDPPACNNNSDSTGGCIYRLCRRKRPPLYRFPHDPSRCLAWLHNCGYNNLPPEQVSSSLPVNFSTLKLCSRHFQESCFFTVDGKKKLLNYAVPTVFKHGPPKYPCQHKSLPARYRMCKHDDCQQLIRDGVYLTAIDEPNQYIQRDKRSSDDVDVLGYLGRGGHARSYVVCDYRDNVEGDEDEQEEHMENELKDVFYKSPIPPMIFKDPSMTTEEKVAALTKEVALLKKDCSLLTFHLARTRGARYRYKRAIQVEAAALQTDVSCTEEQALLYCKQRLHKSAYEFFVCQSLRRKFPPWNFDSLQIPTIANRCGLGVRETLYEIFRMPTLRTFSRYRKILRNNPCLVPDNNIMKNDLKKVYHRRLHRKRKQHCSEPSSISALIKRFIGKMVDDSRAVSLNTDVVKDVNRSSNEDMDTSNEEAYHHKKYSIQQKWKNSNVVYEVE